MAMFFFFFNFDAEDKISANKGDWSELYAHIRLLADGVVYSGDENYRKIENEFFPIIQILRHEHREDPDTVYIVDPAKRQILIRGEQQEAIIPQEQFDSENLFHRHCY